ncbi:increased loss of mitochondrial DNA protein 1 [Staphylotrichum tortipilum]|uniref:Increased loss of mitochondrial DNA protein 1 n=1 Tax=Staphylotrichum tortipilum TaxID=2831512 RepID=A0AAN6MI85_9PEZI|nr:increased loss of mitochondrial DNA protein 1 [Staphylotrichum longicolle]
MALISAKTILTSLCLFHITLGFFFLTNPGTVADQAVVYLLGESMGLPHSRSFESQSPALAFLAVVLALIGITDLVTLSLPDEICLVHYWGMQAPLRLTLTFLLTLYSFLFSPSSPLFSAPHLHNTSSPPSGSSASSSRFTHPSAYHAAHNMGYSPSGWGGDALKNRVFFTFMFVETVSWFWVWVTLQEERREMMARKARRRSGSGYGHGHGH